MPNSSDFNHFAVNPVNIDISRSMFNMDHSVKFSCNVGEVIPFEVLEVLPGDTFEIDTTKVVRLQPLVTPIMDEVIMDVYYFFVPNRLVWNHWINFMGENTSSAWAPTVEYNIPKITIPTGGFNVGTIADYMGVPTNVGANTRISALPFRAYALVCDQWFRSEALMDPVHCYVDDTTRTGSNGSNQITDIEKGGKPFIACKFFDYFTGCLPAPQRGESVSFPITNGTYYDDIIMPVRSVSGVAGFEHPYADGNTVSDNNAAKITYIGTDGKYHDYSSEFNLSVTGTSTAPSGRLESGLVASTLYNGETVYRTEPVVFSNLFAVLDSSNLKSISINDLRQAFAIQKYLD